MRLPDQDHQLRMWPNLLMILLNMTAVHVCPEAGLALSMLMLLAAFILAFRLPAHDPDAGAVSVLAPTDERDRPSVGSALTLLCLFILVITVNSGPMYQVVNPAFAHHTWLTSWYWAVPYIVAVYVLPRRQYADAECFRHIRSLLVEHPR